MAVDWRNSVHYLLSATANNLNFNEKNSLTQAHDSAHGAPEVPSHTSQRFRQQEAAPLSMTPQTLFDVVIPKLMERIDSLREMVGTVAVEVEVERSKRDMKERELLLMVKADVNERLSAAAGEWRRLEHELRQRIATLQQQQTHITNPLPTARGGDVDGDGGRYDQLQEWVMGLETDLNKQKRQWEDRGRKLESLIAERVKTAVDTELQRVRNVSREAAREACLEQLKLRSDNLDATDEERWRQFQNLHSNNTGLVVDIGTKLTSLAEKVEHDLAAQREALKREVDGVVDQHLRLRDWRDGVEARIRTISSNVDVKIEKLQGGLASTITAFRTQVVEDERSAVGQVKEQVDKAGDLIIQECRKHVECTLRQHHQESAAALGRVAKQANVLQGSIEELRAEESQHYKELFQQLEDNSEGLGCTRRQLNTVREQLKGAQETLAGIDERSKKSKRECQQLRSELIEAAEAMDRLGKDVECRLRESTKNNKEATKIARDCLNQVQTFCTAGAAKEDALSAAVERFGDVAERTASQVRVLQEVTDDARRTLERLDRRSEALTSSAQEAKAVGEDARARAVRAEAVVVEVQQLAILNQEKSDRLHHITKELDIRLTEVSKGTKDAVRSASDAAKQVQETSAAVLSRSEEMEERATRLVRETEQSIADMREIAANVDEGRRAGERFDRRLEGHKLEWEAVVGRVGTLEISLQSLTEDHRARIDGVVRSLEPRIEEATKTAKEGVSSCRDITLRMQIREDDHTVVHAKFQAFSEEMIERVRGLVDKVESSRIASERADRKADSACTALADVKLCCDDSGGRLSRIEAQTTELHSRVHVLDQRAQAMDRSGKDTSARVDELTREIRDSVRLSHEWSQEQAALSSTVTARFTTVEHRLQQLMLQCDGTATQCRGMVDSMEEGQRNMERLERRTDGLMVSKGVGGDARAKVITLDAELQDLKHMTTEKCNQTELRSRLLEDKLTEALKQLRESSLNRDLDPPIPSESAPHPALLDSVDELRRAQERTEQRITGVLQDSEKMRARLATAETASVQAATNLERLELAVDQVSRLGEVVKREALQAAKETLRQSADSSADRINAVVEQSGAAEVASAEARRSVERVERKLEALIGTLQQVRVAGDDGRNKIASVQEDLAGVSLQINTMQQRVDVALGEFREASRSTRESLRQNQADGTVQLDRLTSLHATIDSLTQTVQLLQVGAPECESMAREAKRIAGGLEVTLEQTIRPELRRITEGVRNLREGVEADVLGGKVSAIESQVAFVHEKVERDTALLKKIETTVFPILEKLTLASSGNQLSESAFLRIDQVESELHAVTSAITSLRDKKLGSNDGRKLKKCLDVVYSTLARLEENLEADTETAGTVCRVVNVLVDRLGSVEELLESVTTIHQLDQTINNTVTQVCHDVSGCQDGLATLQREVMLLCRSDIPTELMAQSNCVAVGEEEEEDETGAIQQHLSLELRNLRRYMEQSSERTLAIDGNPRLGKESDTDEMSTSSLINPDIEDDVEEEPPKVATSDPGSSDGSMTGIAGTDALITRTSAELSSLAGMLAQAYDCVRMPHDEGT